MTKQESIKDLRRIPGVGISIANDLLNIGITSVKQLKGKDPQKIYDQSNAYAGVVQDRCLLYVFRCAVYFAETPEEEQQPEKLKWWNWKPQTTKGAPPHLADKRKQTKRSMVIKKMK